MGATGDVVRARYSFMYVQDDKDGKWKIGHHHSSQMPEGVVVKQQIGKFEVRNLFNLVRWKTTYIYFQSRKNLPFGHIH
jgi:hypothetical protein